MRKPALLVLLSGWLLIGRPWAHVDAWEEVAPSRKQFRSRAACEYVLAREFARARSRPAGRWDGPRCVTVEDFEHYPKSFIWDPLP